MRDCLCLARVASSRVIGVGGSMRVAMYGMLRAREKAISLGVLSNRVGEEEGVEVTSRAYGVSVRGPRAEGGARADERGLW